MATHLDRYKDDLKKLIDLGETLEMSLQNECHPKEFRDAVKKKLAGKADEYIAALPRFGPEYQRWYSEAKTLLKQLLPARLDDFVRHYEKPKTRRELTFENYRIEDCLQGIHVTRGWEKEKVVDPAAGLPHLRQQVAIVKAVEARFDS